MAAKTEQRKAKISKNLKAAKEKVDANVMYSIEDGVKTAKEITYAKFNETLEVVMKLGVDPRHSDQMVRGVVSLPAGTGKTTRVAVICKEEKVAEAKEAGADIVGSTEVIEDIKAGKINFDVCIATPDMMGFMGQIARILGPKGLMPNPKLGTITNDVKAAVINAKSGQVEFRVEKGGIIHAGVGKLSFAEGDLVNNAKTLISAVSKAKPTGAKGMYVKAIFVKSTMGPSIKIDLASTNTIV